jgi:hypothetical protein
MDHHPSSQGNRTSPRRGVRPGILVLRWLHACVLLAVSTSPAGCWSPRIRPLPPETLATSGRASFDGTREVIFDACVAALRGNGYSIERDERAAGRIFTATLPARTFPAAREGELLLRRYEIQVAEAAGHSAQVTATPMLFDAVRERGETRALRARAPETAWTIAEEEAEWSRLFGAIRHHLTLAATAHVHGAALAGGRPALP